MTTGLVAEYDTTRRHTIAERTKILKNLMHNQASGIKPGLVVQGGGMRGIYSMAALMGLAEAGYNHAFAHVIGSSAGAINSAYFLAEQAKLAVTVYLDNISNRNFVDLLRLRRIVDIDYLIHVLTTIKPLDLARLRNIDTTLSIILTDFETGQPAVVTNRDPAVDLMEALRATAALPILYNKVVLVNGRRYVDGGVADAVPLFRALALGCTDTIVVLTREPSFRRKPPGLLLRILEGPYLRHYPREMRATLLGEDHRFNQTMDAIEGRAPIPDGGRIAVVYPSEMTKMVSRTTNNRRRLLECALMGRNDMRQALGLGPLTDNPFE